MKVECEIKNEFKYRIHKENGKYDIQVGRKAVKYKWFKKIEFIKWTRCSTDGAPIFYLSTGLRIGEPLPPFDSMDAAIEQIEIFKEPTIIYSAD
jgi:hypothetical protein